MNRKQGAQLQLSFEAGELCFFLQGKPVTPGTQLEIQGEGGRRIPVQFELEWLPEVGQPEYNFITEPNVSLPEQAKCRWPSRPKLR